jgi:hypothetical protein
MDAAKGFEAFRRDLICSRDACSLVSFLERRVFWSRSGQGLVLGIDDENREQLCGLGRACIAADAMAGTGCLLPTLAGVVDPLRLIVDL